MEIAKLRPRREFLSEHFSIFVLADVEKYLKLLHDFSISHVKDLQQWIRFRDECESVIDEQCAIAEILYSCNTEDPKREQDYLFVVTQVKPLLMRYGEDLNQKYMQSPYRAELDAGFYAMYDRLIANQVKLFRAENIPLKVREEETANIYGKKTSTLMVTFQGASYTPAQMGTFFLSPDRAVRKTAFEAVSGTYLEIASQIDDVYDSLIPIREQIAHNSGFESYTDYIFAARNRFDYTPQTCFAFHNAIEKHVVPVVVRMRAKRAKDLGIAHMTPWDASVDPFGRAALRPFQDVADLVGGVQKICHGLHPKISEVLDRLVKYRTLDLASRKGKRPGGYQSDLPESRIPFIFMNAVGLHDDVTTFLHELGHAVHSVLAAKQPLALYRQYPIEIAEVASMTMELLGMEGYGNFYTKEDCVRAREDQLYRVVGVLPWVATVDAFQHWLYANPKHSPKGRNNQWVTIYRRFHPDMDWSGYEEALAYRWHRQLHIFLYPHYYIEYGFSQVGALQVWSAFRKNHQMCLEQFLEGLSVGYSRPLPQLYEAVGIRFDFGQEVVAKVMTEVSQILEKGFV